MQREIQGYELYFDVDSAKVKVYIHSFSLEWESMTFQNSFNSSRILKLCITIGLRMNNRL